jgi:hypothetical protein
LLLLDILFLFSSFLLGGILKILLIIPNTPPALDEAVSGLLFDSVCGSIASLDGFVLATN